jgi:hypothetical protein
LKVAFCQQSDAKPAILKFAMERQKCQQKKKKNEREKKKKCRKNKFSCSHKIIGTERI